MPRTVTDWYTDAIAVLKQCRDRVDAMNAPVVQDDLTTAVDLSRQLVHIYDPDAR
jgi:hypothetical protein